jgi:hypothetical protein
MIDSFVFLAPIFLLGVIVLLGFVGCSFTIGVAGETDPIPGPTLMVTAVGDGSVDLAWSAVADATEYHVKRGDVIGVHAPIGQPVVAPATSFPDPGLPNGKTFYYVVSAATMAPGALSAVETEDSNEVEATPLGPFVTSFVDGTPVSPGNGWNGMAIRVGSFPITVQKLGRAFELGMNNTHQMRLVDDAAPNMDKGTTTVNMASETVGRFKYGSLAEGRQTLNAGGLYYVLSQETSGGDQIYDQDTMVTARVEATVPNAVYSTAPGLFVPVGSQNHAYGPVSIMY